MPTTTEITEKYISEHPSIKDCLNQGVINYSKLARKIGRELGIDKKTSMEAVLIACRRYAQKIKQDGLLEKKIMNILKSSELEIKNKIITIIIKKEIYTESLNDIEKRIRKETGVFYAIEGTDNFTLVITEKNLDTVKAVFGRRIIKLTTDLAMITIKSPRELEETPGVVAYLYSLFAEHGINIVETMSCWTDTIFVIADKDIAKVMSFLKF